MGRLLSLIGVLLVLFASSVGAEPIVTISPKWPVINPEVKECGGFPDDSLIMKIKDDAQEITHELCSSYGKVDVRILKDASGNHFLILKSGQGRKGTKAVSEYISIYGIHKSLIEYARIPISGSAGFVSKWYYDYEIKKPKQGGLILNLVLRIEGTDAEWYPKEKKRVIQIK